ncbi:MAG TPA: YMGG-like glycine zipper-containing protein [Gemmatimonadaceae bacterium]|nr:YMGG-like glycine zipper-containing protein [Gemmatimonadaceae bacterium]
MTRTRLWLTILPAAVLLAACGGREQSRADDALSRDLSLAATVQPQYAQPYASPAELGYAPGYGPQAPAPQYAPYGQVQQVPVVYRPAPAPQPAPRTRTIYRAPAPAPAPAPAQPVRHTKRDALIGATAGAIVGASIGRNAKGTLIGAAAGGLLGAAVGHTVDVEH